MFTQTWFVEYFKDIILAILLGVAFTLWFLARRREVIRERETTKFT